MGHDHRDSCKGSGEMRVLIAVDGSDYSMNALDFLAERPWKSGDEFRILAVMETLPMEFGLGHLPETAQSYIDGMKEECEKIVEEARNKLGKKLPEHKIDAYVVSGVVVDQICDMAEEWPADLVVMGSHGRKGLERFLLGSVAEEVLKKASCSVEIVKCKAKEKVSDKEGAVGGKLSPNMG